MNRGLFYWDECARLAGKGAIIESAALAMNIPATNSAATPAAGARIIVRPSRMRRLTLFLLSLNVAFAGCHCTVRQLEPALVADRLYYVGPEGNKAYTINGQFNSREHIIDLLRLDAPIGTFAQSEWILADVLISLDCNANGDVAEWSVSGPQPLIDKYVSQLRKLYDTKKTFYDFGANVLDVKPTAYWEKEEE